MRVFNIYLHKCISTLEYLNANWFHEKRNKLFCLFIFSCFFSLSTSVDKMRCIREAVNFKKI
uniref:Putative ovule protein n=1 Tax=Solanum chacoense TaxID=4108 RepID=A0A0V0HR72_SOLCH